MVFMSLLWSDSVKCKLRVKISYSWLHRYQWHAVQLCNRKNISKYTVNDIHDSSKALRNSLDRSCSQHSGLALSSDFVCRLLLNFYPRFQVSYPPIKRLFQRQCMATGGQSLRSMAVNSLKATLPSLQSMQVPREPILITENEGEFFFFRASRGTIGATRASINML